MLCAVGNSMNISAKENFSNKIDIFSLLRWIMLEKNDEIKLNIDALSSDGSGVGRCDSVAVFVPQSCIGDELEAHILKVKKSYAYAKIAKILKPSADRIEPDCTVFAQCGGCCFRHMKYEAETAAKRKFVDDALERIAKINLRTEKIYPAVSPERYRNKAQYPVRDEQGEIKAGFFAAHSHRVVDNSDCLLEPEEFSVIINAALKFIEEKNISVYNETESKGLIRHIFLRKSFGTGEIMLCLVINGNELPYKEEFCHTLLNAEKNIVSISLNLNKERTNTVLGEKCVTIYGKEYISDVLLGKKFRISPLSFYQINHAQTEKLYSVVRDYAALKDGETLVDLYCGAGTIGICVCSEKNKLVGVEIVPQAVENAKVNARLNGMDNAEFICASAKSATSILEGRKLKADAVVIDPPRKGCDPETIANIISFGAQRIVYVSCNPATLARDLPAFSAKGYEPVRAAAVDLFPRTAHVESVVLMTRQKA